MHLRFARRLAAAGLAGLAALGLAYWLTNEPAPAIRVRWRDDVTAAKQTELERRYLLANGQDPHPDSPRSIAYDLLDTSRANIAVLVENPEAADTNDLDRELYVVAPDASKSSSRTMLFVFNPRYRYAMLGWDLNLLVLLMWLARCRRLIPRRIRDLVPA